MAAICAAHGCMPVSPPGTGAAAGKMLYDLLEVRTTELEMPAQTPDVFIS
jgi:hypothetical protein